MRFNKKLIFSLVLVLIVAGGAFYIFKEKRCPVRAEKRIVRGDSLTPLIKNGDEVEILFGYYICHQVKRGEVVAYSYAGNK